jgi:hypothetical protein
VVVAVATPARNLASGSRTTTATLPALAEQGIQSSAASGAASSTRAATETATSPSYPAMGGQ